MPKIYIDLFDLSTVNALCKICDKYKRLFETDILCGRYIVDGCSVLGVTSMLGHTVEIRPLAFDKDDEFIMNLIE